MEPTIKLFKLVSGENIIATTETNCEDLTAIDSVTLTDPVLVSSVRFPKGGLVYETFVMQPWIALTEDCIIDIATRHILITSSVKESVQEQYKKYLISEMDRENDPELQLEEEIFASDADGFDDFMNEEEEDYYVGDEATTKPTYH